MKGTRHSEEQIVAIMKQGEAGFSAQRYVPTNTAGKTTPTTLGWLQWVESLCRAT